MDNKGNMGLILGFFILVAVLLGLGFLIVIGSSIVNLVFDEIVPEIEGIGTVGSANITQASEYSLTPLNTLVQSFTWIGGLVYIFGLIGLVGLSFAYRTTMNRWFIGIFVLFALLMIMASIFMSNIYEDFYDDSSDLGDRLKEHTMLSWLILNSPLVFTVVIFISGIILFSGVGEEQFI